jgi:hypothetical protein
MAWRLFASPPAMTAATTISELAPFSASVMIVSAFQKQCRAR